ncbi:MAG: cysteine--tRNA ligase [Candidatus Acidifodinimicrobium sp.]
MIIYNTLTKEKETFSPLEKGKVKMYCCGPTVYDYVHIGNLRTFIFYDIIKRIFEHFGYEVKQVINITDVDDKIIKNSMETKTGIYRYTKMFSEFFFEDIGKVKIEPATIYPRATDNIDKMVEIIEVLIQKGFAYKAEDGVYYSIEKFKDYGKLSGVKVGQGLSRIKSDEYDKMSISDFALWKFWDEKDGDVFWDASIGKGRPGWHIECSAMSNRFLGDTLDIHCGGVDLIFPHHENEIAQSEAYTGKKFVNYWVHSEHLLVDGRKMSKSLHNFYTLRDLEDMGFDPLSFRLMCLDSNYRDKLDFTMDNLKRYEKTLNDINISFKLLEKLNESDSVQINEEVDTIYSKFDEALSDDFDTHSALAQFFKLLDLANIRIKEGRIGKPEKKKIIDTLMKMDKVLGVIDKVDINKDVVELAEKRKELRKESKWSEADAIRKEILNNGYNVVDLEDGDYIIVKKRNHVS